MMHLLPAQVATAACRGY